MVVALLVSAWIEILTLPIDLPLTTVALLVSAWIEIVAFLIKWVLQAVALLVSAWIEMSKVTAITFMNLLSHSL